ncbi:MAG: ABC transporter ATP-binding protein [Thermoplasmata archaeon]
MPEDTIISARGLEKIYSIGSMKVHALKGIDLDIKKGEMVAFWGHSGAGKTTLLNCLSGLDRATKGSVHIQGKSLSDMSDNEKSDFRAKHMGFVFQFFNLFSVLTAVENVEMPLILSDMPQARVREKALNMLELVGLREWADHKPSELSGGQQQRVAIARALVNDPDIVWADEPTGNLDTTNSENILSLMKDLNKRLKTTFVIVTHNELIAKEMDKVFVMRNGSIVEERKGGWKINESETAGGVEGDSTSSGIKQPVFATPDEIKKGEKEAVTGRERIKKENTKSGGNSTEVKVKVDNGGGN